MDPYVYLMIKLIRKNYKQGLGFRRALIVATTQDSFAGEATPQQSCASQPNQATSNWSLGALPERLFSELRPIILSQFIRK